MLEIEVKILEIDKTKVIRTLEQLGAEKILDSDIHAEFFWNPEGQKVRLRKVDGKCVITAKTKLADGNPLGRNEHETEFESYDDMANILLSLGCVKKGVSQKHRTSYRLGEIVFDIDEYPGIPCFMEVESTSLENVEKGVKMMGYEMEDTHVMNETGLKEYYGIPSR